MSALAPVMEGFFLNRLTALRASQHTVASYRDSHRLLLAFAHRRTGVQPSRLDLTHIDADLVAAFLDHLETDRGNRVSSRNQRLAAIHALFRYAALRCPEHAELIQGVLAIPAKRCEKPLVTFLTRTEIEVLINVPDLRTPLGRRDQLLLTVAIHTGLRVSELTSLSCGDVVFGGGAHVRCTGKGRRERCTPLTKPLARQLRSWLDDRQVEPIKPLFPSQNGGRMSSDAVDRLLAKHVAAATPRCPSLATKQVTPHTLRHTCAMNLLRAGLDTSSIALWLGHANTQATQAYLHANLLIEEQTLALASPPETAGRRRYRPPDRLLSFLESL